MDNSSEITMGNTPSSSDLEGNEITEALHFTKSAERLTLDPNNQEFNAASWITELARLDADDPRNPPMRSLGIAFHNLNVSGSSSEAEYQATVGGGFASVASSLERLFTKNTSSKRKDILRDFEGIIDKGEMLLVLGPPGSGCSTLLKTLSGDTAGLRVSPGAEINFRGIDLQTVRKVLRGDVLYNAELDVHLPQLTVGDTLSFAASARTSRVIPGDFTRAAIDTLYRDVIMSLFNLTHTVNTRVGDNIIRGVSGGERKRVSIAEAALTGAKFQCWDNATRGLDSQSAITFCQNLRLQADVLGVASAVSIYQAPQSAYDIFDRVTVIYEGRQIFFGYATEARAYFEGLGFECPGRQTTADFLTSMTSSVERKARSGFEDKVPRSAEDFANRWQKSNQRQVLLHEIQGYGNAHPAGKRLEEYQQSRRAQQAQMLRPNSAYMISYPSQVSLTLWRAWRRLRADPYFTIVWLGYHLVLSLILGSMFYNLADDSSSFQYRGALIFFALLFIAFSSQIEVLTIYAERPVVEKHNRYAFYHQSAQAIASFAIDLPYKFVNAVVFTMTFYIMANLNRTAGSYFFFLLVTILSVLSMSVIFRTLACMTRTAEQAMAPTAILVVGLASYAGFIIPTEYMPGWSRWMGYINPLTYALEAMMVNEFNGREFDCATMVPTGEGYDNVSITSQICSVVGSKIGSTVVFGSDYLELSYGYSNKNKWRNIGILFGYLFFFMIAYLFAAEFAKPPQNKGEILIFRRGKTVKEEKKLRVRDLEDQSSSTGVSGGSLIFHWEDLCYDIKIMGEDRRLLDHVDGWVKPGKITALMGVSGAGKTTLLDVLATRVTTGVVSGKTMISGSPTDASFQNRVGYVQQQDLHLQTMTVREALRFSAILRQPSEIPKAEKLKYVEEVIDMLEMRPYADAVIGVPGEGLNIEQRKRLTIGVELAARPQLLIFLDEPTSGLDSQTSWAICQLIKKLTKSGQAILCTIHQPSAMLFKEFDRLLLIAPGGRTAYFGELGDEASTLIDYFERNGAPKIPEAANPAEWMLQLLTPSKDGSKSIDWHQVWRSSEEYKSTKTELRRIQSLAANEPANPATGADLDQSQQGEYVTSFSTQFREVLIRTFKHYWRLPVYIYSKIGMCVFYGLYVGFSFRASTSIQGAMSQMWAIFMLLLLVLSLHEQMMPLFIPQRDLYEVRERPSKIYRWQTYVFANIIVEIAWNSLMALLLFFCIFYPVRYVDNMASDVTVRSFLMFLFFWQFMLLTSTMCHLAITWISLAEIASSLTNFLWVMAILFCGIMIPRSQLPGFWTFMNRVSPTTYLASGMLSTSIGQANITCASKELLSLAPPSNMTCGEFLTPFAEAAGGRILNAGARDLCSYCPMATTDVFLARFDISYSNRWRDFGLIWVYIVVNICAAVGLYWVFRVPKRAGTKRA
ncbi:hypothetical protein VTL71DRAFT_2782 [Oculimacula yallundae]|uniref:ABC transporter domain-containing protein n=1 Tax=Oculimacula yallundae TaxID=86028 RepID=A0ABR4C9V7_9HELO